MTTPADIAEIKNLIAPPEEKQDVVATDDVIPEPEPEVIAQDGDPGDEEGEPAEDNYSIASLAEAIGWEASDLYDVDIGMGEGRDPVKIGALKDKFETVEREKAEMKTQLDSQAEIIAQAQNGVAQGQQMSNDMIVAMGQLNELNRQFQATDWQAIEAENPGEAALMRQKYVEAANLARGQIQQAQQNDTLRKQTAMQEAGVELMKQIPEWADNALMVKEQGSIREAMAQAGYSQQIIQSVQDPIAIKLMRELVQLRAEKASATEAMEKIRKAPKVLKGRGKFPEKQPDLSEIRNKLAGSRNKRRDEVTAAKALMGLK